MIGLYVRGTKENCFYGTNPGALSYRATNLGKLFTLNSPKLRAGRGETPKSSASVYMLLEVPIICHSLPHLFSRHLWTIYYVLHFGGKIMNKTDKISAIMEFIPK